MAEKGARDRSAAGPSWCYSRMSLEFTGMEFVMLKKLGLVASTVRCSSSSCSCVALPAMRTVWRRPS